MLGKLKKRIQSIKNNKIVRVVSVVVLGITGLWIKKHYYDKGFEDGVELGWNMGMEADDNGCV